MSKSHYLHCKSLHSLPKFMSKTQRIQVGNGQNVSLLFVIPIIMDIHGHRFEIYTLVSKIHRNVDIVLGIKNVFELEALGIFDLRSLGYYKIRQGVLQQNLSRFYKFESAEKVCNQFNNLINTLKKEENLETEEKYPWLDKTDERKYMTDRKILEKYVNLDNTCLTEKEKEEIMDMLYKYKEVFSLRDEIGTCPNFEVGIDVTDKSPFFIRPYYIRQEDKKVIDKEMKHLCYLGILKEGCSLYSSPVMLISQKMAQDKKVGTDLRHLNVRIAKNNLAYPLVRDTFSVLGNSKCEVL